MLLTPKSKRLVALERENAWSYSQKATETERDFIEVPLASDLRPTVSVCIPTYRRQQLLKLALQSVVSQDYKSLEIVIGDDSDDGSGERVVKSIRATDGTCIRYYRNNPRLGQNANVKSLFEKATGAYIVLLHDDDVLLPSALSKLVAPVVANERVRVVFGKQDVIDMSGHAMLDETRALNTYFKRDRTTGAIDCPVEAALLGQLPNDGYLIESSLARSVGFRSEDDIGVRVDIDFNIRVGQALGSGEMYFIDSFVSSYRQSDDSISSSKRSRRTDHPLGSVALYQLVANLRIQPTSEYARQALLRTYIDSMIKGFALIGDRGSALRLFASAPYGWRKRLSIKGLYHLALVITPAIDKLRRY